MEFAAAAAWLERQTRGGRPRGPERAAELLAALGRQQPATKFVHVVGTNGKGSVAAYLEAAFGGGGGSFTSPHLVSLRERVRYGGRMVAEGEVVDFVKKVRGLSLHRQPAFFDLMLGLALEAFARHGIDWAALEAGVGGASDATMAVSNVRALVITNVAADHLQTFGGFAGLARDKAGAIRPGRPVITAASGAALRQISELAHEREAPLYVYDPAEPLFSLPRPPALAGAFQRRNAALAVAALRLLGFGEEAVRRGLAAARLPGRLQRLRVQGVEVYLDGAHNPHAAAALVAELPPFHLLFGAHQRKDAAAMLEILGQKALSVTLTWPLAAPPAGLRAPYVAAPEAALQEVLARAGAKKEPVLVTGSFYLLGRLLSGGLG